MKQLVLPAICAALAISAPSKAGTPSKAKSTSEAKTKATQAEIFEKLKGLKGAYIEDGEPGKVFKVSYDLWSRDSALMEVWQGPTKREFTVFHMDNDKLVATHYCGGKIQVTMDLVWPVKDDIYEFQARYVSNHSSPDAPYNSGFAYKFSDEKAIWRRETWTSAGKDNVSSTNLQRLPESKQPK